MIWGPTHFGNTQIHGVFLFQKCWSILTSLTAKLSTCRASERRCLYKVLLLVDLPSWTMEWMAAWRNPPANASNWITVGGSRKSTDHFIHFSQALYLGVSKNNGTPKSSILIGCSIINHSFGGFSPYFWKHPFAVNIRISKGSVDIGSHMDHGVLGSPNMMKNFNPLVPLASCLSAACILAKWNNISPT